jgi:hypothetical protein
LLRGKTLLCDTPFNRKVSSVPLGLT